MNTLLISKIVVTVLVVGPTLLYMTYVNRFLNYHSEFKKGVAINRFKVRNKLWIKPKMILMYTKQFGEDNWWEDTRSQYGIEHCPVRRCVITNSKIDYDRSDAVLFHPRDLPKGRKELRTLRQSSGKQIWIWVFLESPKNLRHKASMDDGMFNWTATYRLESEVFTPYWNVKSLAKNEIRLELRHNFAKGKDKMIIIIMSNCVKERIDLLKQINRYVKVDLYGKCAEYIDPALKNKCPSGKKECEDLKSRYKFYFVIENSFCKDYVTEKFYGNALEKGLVPIVVGGGNFKDPRVAPPNSYINLLDFKDLKSLGDHLNYLDKNDTAYNEYHQWRYSHKVEWSNTICSICKHLWEHDDASGLAKAATSTGTKISEFWNVDMQCTELKTVLKNYL